MRKATKAFGWGGLVVFIVFALLKAFQFSLNTSTTKNQASALATITAASINLEATEQICHSWTNSQNFVGTYTCIRGPIWNISYGSTFALVIGGGLQSAVFGDFNYVNVLSEELTWEGLSKGDCIYVWGNLAMAEEENHYVLQVDPEKDIQHVLGGCGYTK